MSDFGGMAEWYSRQWWGKSREEQQVGLVSAGEPPKPQTPVVPVVDWHASAIITFTLKASSRDAARRFAEQLLGEGIDIKLLDVAPLSEWLTANPDPHPEPDPPMAPRLKRKKA